MWSRSFPLVAVLALLACEPEIGDSCATSSECISTDNDRLCLTERLERFPGGYCTVFNCDPGSCPSEAVCIGYRTTLANAPECTDPGERPRLQRSYCMRTCNTDSDCRSGYTCVDVGGEDPWGAEVLETGSRAERSKICTVAYSGPETEPERSSEVCAFEPRQVDGTEGTENETLDSGLPPAAMSDAAADADTPSAPEAGAPEAGVTPLTDAAIASDSVATDATVATDADTPSAPSDAAAPTTDAAPRAPGF